MSEHAPDFDDDEVVLRIRAGDESAVASLCRQLRPRLAHLARKAGVRPQHVEDMVETVLSDVVTQIQAGSFRGDSQLGTWVIAILRHKVADYFRSRARDPLSNGPADDPEALAQTGYAVARPSQETVAAVRQVLGRLPRLERLILLLNRVGGLTTEDIATRLGRNPKTTGKILWQAKLRFIRLYLGKEDPQGPQRLTDRGENQ